MFFISGVSIAIGIYTLIDCVSIRVWNLSRKEITFTNLHNSIYL